MIIQRRALRTTRFGRGIDHVGNLNHRTRDSKRFVARGVTVESRKAADSGFVLTSA